MKKLQVMITGVLLFVLPCLSFSGEVENKQAKEMFKTAISKEGKLKYKSALDIYTKMINKFPTQHYGGEALFRTAFIYDEKFNNPPMAIQFYKKYVTSFTGRNIRRAKTRLKLILKYENVDMKIYSDYINILNFNERAKRQEQIVKMQEFIRENPDYAHLDDALLWFGNKTLANIRKIKSNDDLLAVKKALKQYLRILEHFPKSDNRIIVLKKAGDCYRLMNNFGNAKKMYKKVYEEGGEKGRILVGKYMLLTDLSVWRLRIHRLCLVVLGIAGALILKVSNLKKMNFKSLKTGMFHSLLFLPCAAIPVALAFILTDASKDNNTGREPFLVLSIMAVAFVVVFINGVIMEAEGGKKINYYIYLPAVFALHICSTYGLFYFFNLLSYVERLII